MMVCLLYVRIRAGLPNNKLHFGDVCPLHTQDVNAPRSLNASTAVEEVPVILIPLG